MIQAQVLSRLLVMPDQLIDLPDEQAIFSFVCRSLLDTPGIAAVRYNAVSEARHDPHTIAIPLPAGKTDWGELLFTVSDREAFAPYHDYLASFCSMLTVILEERVSRRQSEQYRLHLKQMVLERTRQLQKRIDEKQQIEESLRQSQRLLKDAQAISKTGGWEYAVATGKFVWSEEIYHIYDLPLTADPIEIIHLRKSYSPSDQRLIDRAFREARERGKDFDLELLFTTALGNKKWIRTRGQAETQNGEVIRVFGNVADITERKNAEIEIRMASQKWRSTFDAMLDPVACLGLDGQVEQCNRAFANLCNRDIKALKSHKCYQLVHHTGHHIENCPLVRVLQSGMRETMELTSGDRTLFIVADPVKTPDGQVIGVVHIIRDITEQRQAKEALQESNERYRLVAETAHDFILTTDLDYRITFANKAVGDFMGGADPVGLGLKKFTPSRLRAKQDEMMRKRRSGNSEVFSFEWALADLAGSSYIFDVRSQLLTNDGKPSGVLFMARDITARKKTEEEIRTLNERYEMAVNSADIGVWDRDLKTNQLIWDDRMYSLYGISREEFAGTSDAWRHMIHPDDAGRVDESLRNVILNGKHYDTEFRIKRPDGQIRHLKAYGRVQRDEDGQPVRLIGVNYDVTWRKNAEEERRELEEQLFEAQKMEAVGTLAGGIAHDFNNILAAIIGYAELVRDAHDEHKRKEQINRLLLSAGRAKDLVNQILAFSRRAEHDQKPLDLKIIVKEEIKLLRATMPATIEIRQHIPNAPFTVNADLTQMHQVVMNICTNAAHAMGEKGGLIKVVLAKEDLAAGPADALHLHPGPYVRLSISDTGPGIEPDIINRIFEPFFTTKKIGEGTGLGLSVVYGIVKHHNGSVRVDSRPGEGAAFHIYFPGLEEAKHVPDNTPKESLPRGREKILFVDDEKDLAELAQISLTNLGYRVTICLDSLEALDIFQSDPDGFDLVITDMTMPHLSGSELAQQMIKLHPGQSIILCTGYSSYAMAEKAADLGIKTFLLKPVFRQDLAVAVRKALDEDHTANQAH
jgi:PAS domain S-box-containing protein